VEKGWECIGGYNGDLPCGIIKQKAGYEIPSQSMEDFPVQGECLTGYSAISNNELFKGVLTWDSAVDKMGIKYVGGQIHVHRDIWE